MSKAPANLALTHDASGKYEIQSMQLKHHQILDYMLLHEGCTQRQVAQHFNLSETWVSILVNTSLFQEEMARRRGMIEQDIHRSLNGKMLDVVGKGLDVMAAQLDVENADDISAATVERHTRTAMEALGYLGSGASAPAMAGSVTNNNTVVLTAPPDAVEEARRLFNSRVQTAEPIDGETVSPERGES